MIQNALKETNCPSLTLVSRGKVRDVYEVDQKLLIVSTDRISAFDVVMPNPIPSKGTVLNKLSIFWMKKTRHFVRNHLITGEVQDYPEPARKYADQIKGRSMLVDRANVFPIECVVRGYIIGSGWKDYQKTGSVCGIRLPSGLRLADKLPEPLFTPSTKAELGDHDENISFAKVKDMVGEFMGNWLREKTIELYLFGSKFALEKGIIIADTKFEFGLIDGEPCLVDEVLTPDSSRFWPVSDYEPGTSPTSLDKQFLRDYLETLQWDKKPPAPCLPDEVIERTREKYLEIYKILTGQSLSEPEA
mgnify:CR=1 FL=1